MANIKEMKMIFEVTPPEQAILLESVHGVGKSQFIKEYFEKQGYRVIILFLSQMADAGDLIGLPDRVEIDNVKTTIFAQPYWWPKEGEKVVILLDELNRAKQECLQCVQDMVLNRKLCGKPLPPETRIIAAINPYGDETSYDVTELEISLLDRFNKYEFAPDISEWIDYAIERKLNKYIIGFISKNGANYLDPPNKQKTGEVYQSRRSWERLSVIMNNNVSLVEDETKLRLIANSIVGISASSKFCMYVKENMKGVNVGLIITDWNKELEVTIKALPNQELCQVNDELAVYIEQNQKTLFGCGKASGDKYANNVYNYLKVVPKEIIAHFFGLVNQATNNNKSWQSDLLGHSDKLVQYFVTVVNGKDEHDKAVEKMIKDDDDEPKEWDKKK